MSQNPAWKSVASLGRHLEPFHWREAALCVPAMPVLILLGQWYGWPAGGAVAAGAAFAVGFGAARELRGRRWAAMIGALVGMAIAAFAGTVLGQHSVVFLLMAALAAAACAALALYDEDLWWVVLQVVIIFFVAGFYEGSIASATWRAGMVAAGGTAQLAIVWVLAHLFPRAAAAIISSTLEPNTDRRLLVAHMVRAALCVAGSILLIGPLNLANGYWAPMTALIVLKPKLHETRARGLARLGGTIGGCIVATLYAIICRDQPAALLAGVTVAAGAAFALQKAHYASLTASITATVVLLVSLGETSPLANAEHRIVATLIGGILALLVATIIPHSLRRPLSIADRVGVRRAG
jgi:uncharacterized membrane protein YccC